MAGRVEESVWAERRVWIRKQDESGLSVAQFCRDNSLHEGTFHAWRLRFAKLSGLSQAGTWQCHWWSSGTAGDRAIASATGDYGSWLWSILA